jgi:hypothetical protein
VRMEKRAQQRLYTVNPKALSELAAWAKNLNQLWEERFERLDQILEQERKKLAQKRKETKK